jgi:DNA-binding transcriptional regulator GbsR (MarR family)
MNSLEHSSDELHWRVSAVEAVGNVIEFWGFKRNQGRMWAHLYLSTSPKSAAELQDELGMSKGSVSMLLRELEYWRVLKKTRQPTRRAWLYSAETNLKEMIGRVLKERELHFISEVSETLRQAEKDAKAEGIDPKILSRLTKMRIFSDGMKTAMDVFITGAQLDLRSVMEVFRPSKSIAARFKTKRRK